MAVNTSPPALKSEAEKHIEALQEIARLLKIMIIKQWPSALDEIDEKTQKPKT